MLEEYVYKNNKKLRMGYTTGSCAAGATEAAVRMLLSGHVTDKVDLMTPKGILLHLDILEQEIGDTYASCAIRKDAGDDPDATNGILVFSKAEWKDEPGIDLDGGIGVGRVTKKGLEQSIGDPAINVVPRQMIRQAAQSILDLYDIKDRGLKITISIPEGVEIAKKTFNPRLGIMGGISVLGTSGIVEPMSESALIESIRIDIKMQLANDKEYLILVPGNYGTDFLIGTKGELIKESVKCSNFIGEAIDAAVEFGAKGILLIGHIGKFVKLAGGIMNTHSHNADARMDIITAHAAVCGADTEVCTRLMECLTTDDALSVLAEHQLIEPVFARLMDRMEYYVNFRCQSALEVGVLTFSNEIGVLGQTPKVDELFAKLEEQYLRHREETDNQN